MDCRVSLGTAVTKRKVPCTCWEWDLSCLARSLVTILTELTRLGVI